MCKKTILNLYLNTLDKHSNKSAFYYTHTLSHTYLFINSLANKYKQIFVDNNVEKNSNIVFIGNNSIDWICANISTMQFGAKFIPIYESQHIDVINWIINETKPKIIFHSNPITKKIDKLILNEKINLLNYTNINFDEIPEYSFVKFYPKPSDVNLILYTSGTTGNPKGVCLSNENLCSNIESIDRLIGKNFVTFNDKYFNFLPWSHIYGLNCELYYGMSKGASFYINDLIENIPKNIKKFEPTILCTVPKLLYSIYEKIELNKIAKLMINPNIIKFTGPIIKKKIFGSNLRFINTGGSSISSEILEFYKNLNINVYQGYGLSETSPIISLNTPQLNKLNSVGKILDCNDVKIVNGEILVKGSNVFKKYYLNPAETEKSFDSDGYFRTGDTGLIDADNYLYVNGRVKDLYKLTNGKYINPISIENILMESEYISQVFVYGDNKPYNIALIVCSQNINKLSQTNQTCTIIYNSINKLSHKMKKYEIPKKILIVSPFTFEEKLLTPKMSMIRKNIFEKYSTQIEQLYKSN